MIVPPAGEHGVARGALDLVPLRDLVAAPRRREHGEVRRGPVGVDVGEAAGHAARLAQRLARRAHDASWKAPEALPGDRRLERVATARPGARACRAGRAPQERLAPGAGAARRRAASSASPPCARHSASARLELVLDLVRRRTRSRARAARGVAVARAGQRRLERRRSAGRWPGAGPAWTIARTASAPAAKRVEAHRAPGAVRRARLHAHPRLGDDAEDALAAQQQPVGRGPGAGARQPPRRPGPRRG